METSDWIAVCSMVGSVLVTTIGTALYLSFRIGGSNEKMMSMAVSINGLRADITSLKSDIGEVRVDMAEMKVKVDELWRDHVDRRCS
jgi:hypothetical protein